MVHAGYINTCNGTVVHSLLGVPQGGVLSPLLSNIYLHEFDVFMEGIKKEYTQQGKESINTKNYSNIAYKENKARNELRLVLSEGKNNKTRGGIVIQREIIRKAKAALKAYTIIKRSTPLKERVRTLIYYARYADD